MEEYIPGKNGSKRTRDESGLDSVFDSPESKRVTDGAPIELQVTHNSSPAGRLSWPEAKQIREDILDILDEPEEITDGVPEIDQELNSVIKSFEEEILHPSSLPPPHPNSVDLTLSDSGESQSDLGYLLEASDDELGLPPTVSQENYIDAESRLVTTGFDNELLRYDSFDLGMLAGIMDGDYNGVENDGDFVTVGGLFDSPDPSNFSDLSRLPESLPAL